MNMLTRPGAAIALILTTIVTTGCPSSGNCGNLEYENEEMISEHALEADGTVLLWDANVVDPATVEGCEALCVESAWGNVETVHSCEADIDPDAASDTAVDTADTGESNGIVTITCVTSGEDFCLGGRHIQTLVHRAHGQGPDAVAAWLAREACGEAGSVLAFRQLVRELKHHGAPQALIDAARAAAGDEVRHTRMVRRLALQRGGTPDPVIARPTPARDLLTVALENAVEGCVHETFAAARAGWQARHAADRDVRQVSAVLAQDEARHADLAAMVHAWACSVLPSEQAEAVEAARQEAWAHLADAPPAATPATAAVLGLPDAPTHHRLVQALAVALQAA